MNRSSSIWLTSTTCTRKEANLCSRQEYTLIFRLCSRCLERRSWGQLQRSSAKRALRFSQQLFETMAILLIHAVPSSYAIPQHKLWVEQPENFPTCLATKPCPKEVECLVGTLSTYLDLTPRKCRNTSKSSNSTRVQSLRENLLLVVKNEHHLWFNIFPGLTEGSAFSTF